MIPKKTKELIPEIAKKLQLSEQEVKSVMDVYWSKVQKALSSLEYNRIYLKGLGTFYIKPWSVDKKLQNNSRAIENYTQNPTPSGLTILNNLFKDNIKLQKAAEAEKANSEKWKQKRDERRNSDLEGKGQDS